ncbi:MAG: UDP-3-O-(3-hydroxymyristoyl)glucosamine N-acyltransferase [Phycisphaerales bacterium]|nr:UDP-3-O-(3-hydroxymyristoyl)glucosamine N-acyltransferase [Phycisphaerales bacterium]
MDVVVTVGQIAQLLNTPSPANAQVQVTGLNTLEEATESELSFCGAEAYVRKLSSTRAAAVIVPRRLKIPAGVRVALLVVEDADLAMAQVLERFAPPVPRPAPGVDRSARIDPSAVLGNDIAIGPNVVVGAGSRLGDGCILHAGVYIGQDVMLGDGCEFFPGVIVRERITIGNRVIIHAGSVLGTDGFGYRWDGHRHVKIPQIGTIIIEDEVEIGSCVCIDRAKFSTTRIGFGTKIDNLVQIGHNVVVGPHCIIVGQAGLAGSAKLGTGVVLGGQTAVRDHVTIGDAAMAAACAAIADDVEPKAVVSGMPALPHRQSLREQAALRRLPDLVVQVRKLQEEVESLRKGISP